jgi:hypothetical protein
VIFLSFSLVVGAISQLDGAFENEKGGEENMMFGA